MHYNYKKRGQINESDIFMIIPDASSDEGEYANIIELYVMNDRTVWGFIAVDQGGSDQDDLFVQLERDDRLTSLHSVLSPVPEHVVEDVERNFPDYDLIAFVETN